MATRKVTISGMLASTQVLRSAWQNSADSIEEGEGKSLRLPDLMRQQLCAMQLLQQRLLQRCLMPRLLHWPLPATTSSSITIITGFSMERGDSMTSPSCKLPKS